MTVAAQEGTRPSAVIGIGCTWCAYCFDEALVMRDWDAMREAGRAMEAGQESTFHHNNARDLIGKTF